MLIQIGTNRFLNYLLNYLARRAKIKIRVIQKP